MPSTAKLDLDAGPLYRPMRITIAALVLASILFVLAPSLDLAVSRLFYTPGRGFTLADSAAVVAIRNLGIGITWITGIGLAALALWWRLRPAAVERWHNPRPRADWVFVAAGMALGPGVLVNLILKPVFGRARPRQIAEFSGPSVFSSAWMPSGQCSWGCSFVSGEAAATTMVLAFAVVAPARWRVAVLLCGILMTLAISFARIAAGGHFLSDVVIASLLMLLVMLILHAQIYHGALLGPFRDTWYGLGL